MAKINFLVVKYPELFKFQKAQEVHPHDHFLNFVLLRFLPDSITPNMITAFRVVTTPYVFYLILSQQYYLGVFVFLFVAFTDALDGSLARTRNRITQFGSLFDPLADKFLIGSLVLLLVFKYFSALLGFAILSIEIIFILAALVAKIKFKTVRMANVWGKVKMILQVLAVFLTLIGILLNAQELFTFAAWVFGAAVGFAIVSLFAHGI